MHYKLDIQFQQSIKPFYNKWSRMELMKMQNRKKGSTHNGMPNQVISSESSSKEAEIPVRWNFLNLK